MSPLLAWVPCLLYLAASVSATGDLVRARPAFRVLARVALLVALVTRVATLLQPGMCPVSAGSSGSLVALFLSLHLLAGFRRDGGDRARVAVQLALIFALDVVSTWITPHGAPAEPPEKEKALGVIHGGLVLLAYAAFFIGALYAVLYLALYRLMRRRRLGFWFSRLPSLERLEARSGASTLVGLGFLTAGLALGQYSYAVYRGGVPYDNAKFVVAGLVWLVFAAEVVLRRLGWRGIRVMWVPLVGVLVVVLLFGVSAGHPFWSPA